MDDKIKLDPRNYRVHDDRNKQLINKSLTECGAGRSILVDRDNVIIAGNGVYRQAEELGLKVRVIESDGEELIVVKRTDLTAADDRRKLLALADNHTSDTSQFDFSAIIEDFDVDVLGDWEIEIDDFSVNESDLDSFFDSDSKRQTGKSKVLICPHCGKNIHEEVKDEKENNNL